MKKTIVFFGVITILMIMAISAASADTITIRPNAQGNYSAWTNANCGSGSLEWQCVDDYPTNTTDNLYISAANIYETFAFQDVNLTDKRINSVTLYFYGQRYSSTRYQFQPIIRQNGTNYIGSVKSLTSSYATYYQMYTTNPATGLAWTASQINALEAGMKSNSANYGGRIANVYAMIDYNTLSDSCNDTDGGNVTLLAGTVYGSYNYSNYSNSDSCINSSIVNEYFCYGNYKYNDYISCGNDAYVGSNFCQGGDVYRNYTDYSCASGACGSNTTLVLQQDCTVGQICSNGQCVTPDSCNDTDGGFNIEVFGNVTGYLNQTFFYYGDFCLDNTTIQEYFCSGTSAFGVNSSCYTNSTWNCYNGRCI